MTSRHFVLTSTALLLLLVPPLWSGEVTLVRNLQYKTGTTAYEQERSKLDLYLPADSKGFSAIVWFHGGGLTAGGKDTEEAIRVGRRFAAEGVATAVVDYRLSPGATYPAYIADAAASVAWVLSHIGEYGGNQEAVFVGGHSAGGYLAAMVAMDNRYLAAEGTAISDIAGAIPVSGQMDSHSTVRAERGVDRSVEIIDETAPLHYVHQDLPPMLILAGSDDLPGRSEINRRFQQALQRAGHKDSQFIEVAGRDHTSIVFEMDDPEDEVVRIMLDFINRH